MEKIRIQKLLSDAGYCSRRKAEALIAAGKVKLNGHPVKLGDQATRADLITVNGEAVRIPRKKSSVISCCTSQEAMSPLLPMNSTAAVSWTYWTAWKNGFTPSADWTRTPKDSCC